MRGPAAVEGLLGAPPEVALEAGTRGGGGGGARGGTVLAVDAGARAGAWTGVETRLVAELMLNLCRP